MVHLFAPDFTEHARAGVLPAERRHLIVFGYFPPVLVVVVVRCKLELVILEG
jgi:hypothetical protein